MITIVDYNAGNIKSVTNALDRIGVKWKVTNDPKEVVGASKIIMPGVGSACAAMEELNKRGLADAIKNTRAPFLGICLGMQVLFERSEEGDTECLGIIKGRVIRFDDSKVKVPQMGWNRVRTQNLKLKCQNHNSKLKTGKAKNIFDDSADNSYFYFVHSYYCVPEDKGIIIATANYGGEFCAAVQHNNFYGVQFHPEKSGDAGMELIARFCDL